MSELTPDSGDLESRLRALGEAAGRAGPAVHSSSIVRRAEQKKKRRRQLAAIPPVIGALCALAIVINDHHFASPTASEKASSEAGPTRPVPGVGGASRSATTTVHANAGSAGRYGGVPVNNGKGENRSSTSQQGTRPSGSGNGFGPATCETRGAWMVGRCATANAHPSAAEITGGVVWNPASSRPLAHLSAPQARDLYRALGGTGRVACTNRSGDRWAVVITSAVGKAGFMVGAGACPQVGTWTSGGLHRSAGQAAVRVLSQLPATRHL